MRKDTVCIHAARYRDEPGAIATPIDQSATFVHKGIEEESPFSSPSLVSSISRPWTRLSRSRMCTKLPRDHSERTGSL